MDKEKKRSNNTTKSFLLGAIASGIIMFYLKDKAGISSIFDWLLYTVGCSVAIFIVSGLAAAVAGAILQKFDGEERKIGDPEVLAAMLVALVAAFLIIKGGSVGPQDVAKRMPLNEVLGAYEKIDDYET